MNYPKKTLRFPGDKSISHRLVLLSLLINKSLAITNLSSSKDVETSLDIVKKLGVEVSSSDEDKTVVLSPLKRKDFGEKEIVLDCGNSGTTARLLCGILSNLKGRFKLIGDESLSKRPMERVVRPLADLMGVDIKSVDGHLPIIINANGKTKAVDFYNETGSAQVKSAVLFAGLAAEGDTTVREKVLSRDHTERLLQINRYGGRSACSTLFSSAVSENNSLRSNFEGTSLVRRIEGLASAARDNDRYCELQILSHECWGSCCEATEGALKQSFEVKWQSSKTDGGQSACSTLFSSAVSENNSLRSDFEGTSLVRRIEGLASAARDNDRYCDLQMLLHECWGNCCEATEGASKQSFEVAWQSNISDDGLEFCVPGDISSAAYFIVLSLITGKSLKIENILLNPTRTGFIKVLKRMGADIEEQVKEEDWEPIGDLIVKGGELKATDITADEIPSVIDELPILAVAMAFTEGKSRVSGASELRVKESDRISGLISQLQKAGVDCSEYEDGFEINGGNKIVSAELDSFNDHRLAMSFAVLARASGVDIKVRGRESAAVSFPEFYDYL